MPCCTARRPSSSRPRAEPSPTDRDPERPRSRCARRSAPIPRRSSTRRRIRGDRKLGLGASSAILVASLAVRAAERGADLARPDVRAELFWKADSRTRKPKAAAAASTSLPASSAACSATEKTRCRSPSRSRGDCTSRSSRAPRAPAPPSSGRTSIASPRAIATPTTRSCASSRRSRASRARSRGRRRGPFHRRRSPRRGLSRRHRSCVGRAHRPSRGRRARRARAEDAAFCVSGAGGGDVVVFFGASPPSDDFVARARALGLAVLDVGIDEKGVRIAKATPAEAEAATRAATP